MKAAEIVQAFYDGRSMVHISQDSANTGDYWAIHGIEMLLRGYMIGLRAALPDAEVDE